jgi:Lrp/AsnC family transcriptional regulator, regulator for asnA, asnC and gidA
VALPLYSSNPPVGQLVTRCDARRTLTLLTTDFDTVFDQRDEIRVAPVDHQLIPFRSGDRASTLRIVVTTPEPHSAVHALLDDVGKAIVEQLQEDGRRPYATIARSVGLSEAAVRQRVARLQEAGVIQIVAVTDPLQLGFRRQAMVGVRADGDVVELADALAAMPEVDYVVITAGSFDVLAEAVCEDDEHLLELVGRRIRALPGVRSTETFVYMKLRKQHYNWGTR